MSLFLTTPVRWWGGGGGGGGRRVWGGGGMDVNCNDCVTSETRGIDFG